MFNKARFVLVIILSLFILGCASEYQPKSYNYAPPDTAEGKSCVAQCQHSKNLCEKTCTSGNNSDCLARAKEQGQLKYNEYLLKQQAAGQPVERNVNSFIDLRQCRNLSCRCDADYNACYQLCGGNVISH